MTNRFQRTHESGPFRRFGGLVLLCASLLSCGPPSWPGGIHAQLVWSPHAVRVVEVPVDSVADRAGLREGDRLIAVDGQPVEGLSSRSLRERLTGEVGSFVSLRVVRGEQELTLRIERAPYQPRARDKPQ